MTRRLVIVFVLLVCALGTVPLSAHDDFRIIGTLEKHQDSTIAVAKKNTGKIVSIKIDKKTVITQGDSDTKLDTTALKSGQTLVIDAYGDSEDGSLALEIRIVPPIGRGGR